MSLDVGTTTFGKSRSDRFGGAGPHEVMSVSGARGADHSSGAASSRNTAKTSTSTYELYGEMKKKPTTDHPQGLKHPQPTTPTGSQQSVEVPLGSFEGARPPGDASNSIASTWSFADGWSARPQRFDKAGMRYRRSQQRGTQSW